MERTFIGNKIFSCRLILGASVHQKIVQIGPTILALKLDKEKVLGIEQKLIYFFNNENDIQS